MSQLRLNLDGGIGNLLFQYSAALKLQTQFKVSLQELTLGLIERLETYVGEIDSLRLISSSGNRFLPKTNLGRLTTKWIPDFTPCELPYSKRVRLLKGHFQHSSWYGDSFQTVLEKIKTKHQSDLISVAKNVTAIHLRRSDYVRLGWDLPMSYYEKAISLHNNIIEGPVAIFSDDQIVSELFTNRLSSAGLTIYKDEHGRSPSALHDFLTISKAQTIIMSNSTFCWWAVKLAQYSNSEVVAYCPSTWLPDSKSNVLIDSTWIKA